MRAADEPRAARSASPGLSSSACDHGRGPTFPGDPPVEIHPAATIERDGYHLQSLVADEQAGTHRAAPAHFVPARRPRTNSTAATPSTPRSCSTCGLSNEDPEFALGVAEIMS